MSALSRLLLLSAMLALAGCASVPPPATVDKGIFDRHQQQLSTIAAFSLSGRLAVQTQQKGFSGKLRWQHAPGGDMLDFYSPLGSQVAAIVGDADGVVLTTSDQKTYTAADAETLLHDTMGWSLPLQGLSDWVLGRPAPGAYQDVRWDDQGRLTFLVQNGWHIEYPSYQTVAGTDLPTKIVLKSPKLDLKLLVEQWQDTEPQP